MKIKLIIFDWDGTLSNSLNFIFQCLNQAAQAFSLPAITQEHVFPLIGLGGLDVAKRLYPNETLPRQQAFLECYRQQYYLQQNQAVELYPGVRNTLCCLLDRGYRLAVATGKNRLCLNADLAHANLNDFFIITRTAEETASKPDPKMLHEIMIETHLQPDQCLMVGDTVFDLQMAQNCGMPSVGVSYGAHSLSQLEGCLPLAIIDDVRELPLFLSQNHQSAYAAY